MITKVTSFIIILFIYCEDVIGQDSVMIVFKNVKIILPKSQPGYRSVIQDSKYLETIFDIGKGRYFYIKQNAQDSLVVEAGQLHLYSISNVSYLLREGIWSLESESKKVLFSNFGEMGLIEEVEVDTSPVMYNGVDKKRKKPIRRAVTRTIEY